MPKARETRQVFISWSGKRSLAVAESLCEFIPRVIPELKDRLFVSTGIEKGSRWSDEIARHLEEADAGILCLTAEGLSSPWLHFEAGALTKGLDASRVRRGEDPEANTNQRIFTYLHGLAPNAFTGPLSQYQWTAATHDDTWRLMSALHDLFARGRSESRPMRTRFDDHWPELEHDLKRNAVLVADVIFEFESWFQQQSFVEALDECTDKDWIGRYDGARDAHALLGRHAAHVRDGCARYQWELYQELTKVTDAYVTSLRPLLRALPDDGSPAAPNAISHDVATTCERERARVNGIVQLVLHPVAIPLAEDAVAFCVSDSIEQRKLLAQQYETTVREIADRRATLEHATAHGDAPTGEHTATDHALDAVLATADSARKLFRSLWALDRIVGYLAWSHLFADTPSAADLLAQRATSELETVQSQNVDANPLPLQYSLEALASALHARHVSRPHDVPAIRQLCSRVEGLIDGSRTSDGEPMLDRGKRIRATLVAVRSALDALSSEGSALPLQPAAVVPDPLEDA